MSYARAADAVTAVEAMVGVDRDAAVIATGCMHSADRIVAGMACSAGRRWLATVAAAAPGIGWASPWRWGTIGTMDTVADMAGVDAMAAIGIGCTPSADRMAVVRAGCVGKDAASRADRSSPDGGRA